MLVKTEWISLFLIFICNICRGCSSTQNIKSVGEAVIQNLAQGVKETVNKIETCGLPKIQNLITDKVLKPGGTARMTCSVDMQCMVSYIKWYKKLQNGTFDAMKTGVSKTNPYLLEIQNVSLADSGEYRCVAGNVLGETSISVQLSVNTAVSAELAVLSQ